MSRGQSVRKSHPRRSRGRGDGRKDNRGRSRTPRQSSKVGAALSALSPHAKMCPLREHASAILRAWSEDVRRGRRSGRPVDPEARETKAVIDYVKIAVDSKEKHLDKGRVPNHVETVYQEWVKRGSPEAVMAWGTDKKSKLQSLKDSPEMRASQERHVQSLEQGVKQVAQGIQLPLMVKMMRQAGMSMETCHFIRTVFSKGADYVGPNVPLTGLYDKVKPGTELGKYEVIEPAVLKKVFDLPTTLVTNKHVRVPDSFVNEIYQETLKESKVDVDNGTLPFSTVLGPFRTLQSLPAEVVHPAFRFWVEQDTASGADPGRVVDDLTASGANGRTPIREKLSLPSLDDFVKMVRRVFELCPEHIWGHQEFFKHDLKKAFRQVPGSPQSRAWGAFAVTNPEGRGSVEIFQHLSLPFGARASPLIFCAVAQVLCELAAFHLGVPIVAFVDDFFAATPSRLSQYCFDAFKWMVVDLLGFHLKLRKEESPGVTGKLLGVEVSLTGKGHGSFRLPEGKKSNYLSQIRQILAEQFLSPGKAAKLAGALSFAASVSLARFGRPFLQPLYATAAGRSLEPLQRESDVDPIVLGPKGSRLPPRLQNALEWWVQILESFPGRKFEWGAQVDRPIRDLFTDASAEEGFEGLGGVLFEQSVADALTVRVDQTPKCLESFLPSKEDQAVRIAQLELLAVLICLKVLGPRLRGTYVRFHIDNVAAMYCCLNAYSSNSFMSRLGAEIWVLCLLYDIVPWFQYVPSKLNVSDIWSRPDRKQEGRRLSHRFRWRSVSPTKAFRPLADLLSSRPDVTWGPLFDRLYGGRRLET